MAFLGLSNISFKEKLLFTKHLSVMIRSGLTVTESLSSLIEQNRSHELRDILERVLQNVKNGQSLSKSLQKFPRVFDKFYISLVHVGEESGSLDEALDFLAQQMAKSYSLQQKVRGALLYPGLVFSTTFVMGGFISLFVLPQLVEFFDAFEVELPFATKVLLFVANIMKDYGMALFGGLVFVMVATIMVLRVPFIKSHWHGILLKLPLFGQLFEGSEIARFSRNLGTLLKSGVSIIVALDTVAQTLDNVAVKKGIVGALDDVEKGKPLAKALQGRYYTVIGLPFSVFPSLVIKMIAVGEESGNLEGNLLYLADFYEEEIDNFSKNLTTILEPIMLVIIGLVVGFVALAIISPIYELTGSIR
jgi:type IV pilus assembly protein PilC